MPPQLRLFPATDPYADGAPPATVRVSLSELLPLLTFAQRHNYLWLQDFLDDEIRVTEDLYEVLRSFGCQRPNAS